MPCGVKHVGCAPSPTAAHCVDELHSEPSGRKPVTMLLHAMVPASSSLDVGVAVAVSGQPVAPYSGHAFAAAAL